MAVETVPISRPDLLDRPERLTTHTRIGANLKEQTLLFGMLYLLPPLLKYIGRRYPLREKVATWINGKLEKRAMEPIDVLTKVVKPEDLGNLPDILDNMPRGAQLKLMISYGSPKIREHRGKRRLSKILNKMAVHKHPLIISLVVP